MNEATTMVRAEGQNARLLEEYRDVMVHLDGTSEDEVRLAHAETIATLNGGHLTGIYTNIVPDSIIYSAEAGAAAIAALEEQIRRQGEEIRHRLAERFTRLGIPSEVRKVEAYAGTIGHWVAREARWGDLFVASCPQEGEGRERWKGMIEDVLFEGGRALYLVPPGVQPRSPTRTVLIGWADTREVARAIRESLPLLRVASVVELVHVQEPVRNRMGGAEAMADIAAHLARHGIKVQVRVVAERTDISSALLDEAHRISADLIVVGAYGHSRLREWIVGGATRDLLETSNLPLLMVH